MTNPRTPGAIGRIAERERQAKRAADFQQATAHLDPEYIAKLRLDCLRSANMRLRGASPDEIVREAARDLEERLRFLMNPVGGGDAQA